MNHRILVTGGGGYIGAVLVPLLLEQGFTVTVTDSFLYRENSLAACCRNPRFSVYRVDIRDTAGMVCVAKPRSHAIRACHTRQAVLPSRGLPTRPRISGMICVETISSRVPPSGGRTKDTRP